MGQSADHTISNNNHVVFALPGVILTSFLAAYWPVFQKVLIHWQKEDNSYCFFVIPMFLYLCWDMRERYSFGDFSWNPLGLIVVALFAGLTIMGELGSLETFLYAGVWGVIASSALVFYGRRTLDLWFAFLVLLFIVPLPPFINRMFTFKLKMISTDLSVAMLRLCNVSVSQEGNIIDLGINQLQVVDACSGLRYFIPMILSSLLIGYFFTTGWWRRVLLVALVPPMSVLSNGFRIFLTGILTEWGHAELATSFFHEFSGWLLFMLVSALVAAIALLLRRSGPAPKGSRTKQLVKRRGAGYPPLVLAITLCLIFAGNAMALKTLSSTLIIPERKQFETFPMKIGSWEGKRSYLPEKTLEALWADDYVKATYREKHLSRQIRLLIPYYEYQGTRHTAHAPQSCMLGSGWSLMENMDRAVEVGSGKVVEVKSTVWENGGNKLLGAYFFFQRGRVITSPWLNKYYLMLDALVKNRTDGALVRIEMPVSKHESLDDTRIVIDGFLSHLWPLLPDYVPE